MGPFLWNVRRSYGALGQDRQNKRTIRSRIAAAWATFHQNSEFLLTFGVSIALRLKALEKPVLAAIVWGVATAVLSPGELTELNGAYIGIAARLFSIARMPGGKWFELQVRRHRHVRGYLWQNGYALPTWRIAKSIIGIANVCLRGEDEELLYLLRWRCARWSEEWPSGQWRKKPRRVYARRWVSWENSLSKTLGASWHSREEIKCENRLVYELHENLCGASVTAKLNGIPSQVRKRERTAESIEPNHRRQKPRTG